MIFNDILTYGGFEIIELVLFFHFDKEDIQMPKSTFRVVLWFNLFVKK